MKLITPNTKISIKNVDGRLFYLLGPVEGGGDWQRTCCDILNEYLEDRCWIANPRRYEPDDPLNHFRVDGTKVFEHQILWRRHYQDMASRIGCIIAWLPRESRVQPRIDGQSYALDIYGDLGEWRGRMKLGETSKLVLGGEPGFPGLDLISRNFDEALGQKFPIYGSLEEVVAAAIGKTGGLPMLPVR